jgi:hypothetical protein
VERFVRRSRLVSSGSLLFGVALLQHDGKLSAELLHLVLDRDRSAESGNQPRRRRASDTKAMRRGGGATHSGGTLHRSEADGGTGCTERRKGTGLAKPQGRHVKQPPPEQGPQPPSSTAFLFGGNLVIAAERVV